MGNERVIKSACRMCHGVCQVLVHVQDDRVVKITGDPDSPTSKGYICPKGIASVELLYHPDRILYPMKRDGQRGENKWRKISWDQALDEMASKLRHVKESYGSQFFGMMHGTGRPYENLGARFAKAFGTPNFTGVAHICFWPRVYANIVTQGMTELPVCDVYGLGGENPACVVIWGCNLTGSTGHNSSDGMCGGMLQRTLNNANKVIVIDPRRISPAIKADHWLQIRPGTDGALALALINVIIEEDLVDHSFIDQYTIGYEKLADHIKKYTPEWAQTITGIKAEDIRDAARTYATVKPGCMQWGNAIDHSMCNFQTARSLLILRALTGNLYIPGGEVIFERPQGLKVKFPYLDHQFSGIKFMPFEKYRYALDGTKQPDKLNVAARFFSTGKLRLLDFLREKYYPLLERMSENKGMAEQLAFMHDLSGSRYPLSPVVHPPTFWKSIVSGDSYRLRALWVLGSNPLVTMSNSRDIEKALGLVDYIVVTDFFLTPTAQYADLFLPASTWLEYDEIHNSGAHTFSVLARKKIAKVGDTLDDQEIIIQLARRLGMIEAFPWKNHRELTDWMLEDTGLSFEDFCTRGILAGKPRYYPYKQDKQFFKTASGKFEIYSKALISMGVSPLPVYREPAISPLSKLELVKDYPLVLIGGVKVKHFFHSEGRQIQSLRAKNPDPLVEINPQTAANIGCINGDWVWIETPEGRVKMKVKVFDGIAENVVCAQYGWWFPEEKAPEYGWKKSSINLIMGKMDYDPDTGSESLKSTLCKIYPVI